MFTVLCQRLWHGYRTRQILARITLFGCVLVRRPALIRFRQYLGRGEAGGEDSMHFPVSDCKHWHKNEARVNGCLRVSILLMVRGSLLRTRTRTRTRNHVFRSFRTTRVWQVFWSQLKFRLDSELRDVSGMTSFYLLVLKKTKKIVLFLFKSQLGFLFGFCLDLAYTEDLGHFFDEKNNKNSY